MIGPSYEDRDWGLRADSGFIPRVDIRDARGYVGRQIYGGHDDYSNLQPRGLARLSFNAEYDDTIDFQSNRPARLLSLSPGAELKIGRHVNALINHTLQRLDVDGGSLFEANLSQLRLVYNFNARLFVRGIFQYLDLRRDVGLYLPEIQPLLEPKEQTLLTQLLFFYKLNAQTVFFLGYSDDQLGTRDFGLARTDRTFFLKVGYAWVM